jgi:hypothetical protein
MKNTYNLTGNAGEYFVCSELIKLNILPLLTPNANYTNFKMHLYKNQNNQVISLKEKPFKLEKEIQNLFEANILTMTLAI